MKCKKYCFGVTVGDSRYHNQMTCDVIIGIDNITQLGNVYTEGIII